MRDRDRSRDVGPHPDADPSDGWIIEAVAAGTLDALRDVARSARAMGALTPRDQAWCRALAEHLSNVDAAAMREVVAQLGAVEQ